MITYDSGGISLKPSNAMHAAMKVDMVNTDAERRLVMADAIALANEDGVDAIVDIATLTGACLPALGTLTAGVIGNDDTILSLVEVASTCVAPTR
ncbi:hypothetical protein [Cellulomonas composti]|uniref:Probable cytosol aminopeptidase n=1 Tax=Cellulomonas composti TaxID=266130 RepID=A0A511J8J6_9CELL|nr:hypothetical protein CCO02nite_07010 [Cellulomonas composti]